MARAGSPNAPATKRSRKKPPASTALTIGPITAIQNSAFGRSDSRPSAATPPKMKRTIERTGTPKRCAVSAWPNSWRSTDANRRRVASAAVT